MFALCHYRGEHKVRPYIAYTGKHLSDYLTPVPSGSRWFRRNDGAVKNGGVGINVAIEANDAAFEMTARFNARA